MFKTTSDLFAIFGFRKNEGKIKKISGSVHAFKTFLGLLKTITGPEHFFDHVISRFYYAAALIIVSIPSSHEPPWTFIDTPALKS